MLTRKKAMKQSATRFAQGEIVKGTVIELRPKEVLVDIGYKAKASSLSLSFWNPNRQGRRRGGCPDREAQNKDGTVVLSHQKAEFKKTGTTSSRSATGRIIKGKVLHRQGRAGRHVGVEAFLPGVARLTFTTPKNLTGLSATPMN